MADDDDDIDIYGDLTNFNEKSNAESSEYALELKKKCSDLEDKVANFEKELKSLQTIKNTLEVNLSSLVKTAKTEIARKDRMIAELRAELENSVFRRGNFRIPKINRKNDPSNTPTIKPTEVISIPTTRSDTTSTHFDSIAPTCLKPVTPVDNDGDNDDDDEEGGGEIYQPNKFASTVYGERLRRKIMEQDAAEKLKKEQLKLDALASVISENKDETNTNIVKINRDDKENEFNQVALNEDNIEIPTKISLKRSNDGVLNGHCDKRKKTINHANPNIDKKGNDKSQILNIPAPHKKMDEKINNQLEPIGLRLLSLSQKRDEEFSIEKQSNDLRDNYHDKYRSRRSNSRSKSGDLNRRRNSRNRSREPNRQCDFNRSDHYRSSTNRYIQNKSENRRSSRDRTTEKSSSGSRREMDLHNHINYHGRRRPDGASDRRFEMKDKREPHKRRERSSRSQYDRIDSYTQGTKNADERKRNRSRSATETFSDKSNDSVIYKKLETYTSPKVQDDVVMENEVANSIKSLEEGEIVGSPKLTPQKDMLNTVISEKKTDKMSMYKRTNDHLLVTLSTDTPKIDIASRSYPKSPQEENIENIAGFIRNFTYHNMSNDIPSTIQIELPNSLTDSSCNTTKNVTEALEHEPKDTARIDDPESVETPQNIVQPWNPNNINRKQRELPPTKQATTYISESRENINDLLSEPKAMETSTISINNVSTPYADVLSKYVRRKRKSTTSDADVAMPEENLSALIERSHIKDVDESESLINNESVSPARSKQDRDNANHANMQKQTGKISDAVVIEPLRDLPCQGDAISPTNSRNASEIPKSVTINEKIHIVDIINVKSGTSETAAKLPNSEICNDYSGIGTVKENENGDIAEEVKKLTSVNNVLILEDYSSNNDPIHHAVCTPMDTLGEFRSTGEQTIESFDAENNARKMGNKTVETETKKSSEIKFEDMREQKCEEETVKNTEYIINSCKKIVPTRTHNERKIVVARRKKRPVQLTNSSNSLTVVLSAYNVNNNRVCKSRVKMPVTLSDT